MEHSFNTNIAAKYDVNIAIILHFFKRATDLNISRSNWVEITPEYLQALFPFWSFKKIISLTDKLIKLNLMERKQNTSCFYSLTPSALSLYEFQAGNI